MWRQSSSVKLCTYIIQQSEAQTFNCRNKRKNTFLTGRGKKNKKCGWHQLSGVHPRLLFPLRPPHCADGVLAFALFTRTLLSWLLLLNTAGTAHFCACWCWAICSCTGGHYIRCLSCKDTVPAAPVRRTFVALLLMSFLVCIGRSYGSIMSIIFFISAAPMMQIAEMFFDRKLERRIGVP